ncbi:MAG: superoxide dismutase family protein [Gemmatimonadota bacterium]
MSSRRFSMLGLVVVLAGLTAWGSAHPLTDQQEAAYRAQITGVDGSGAKGLAALKVQGEQLTVRMRLQGVASGRAHGVHIHSGSSCDSPGGVLVPLDQSLGTIEDGFGGTFPTANEKGQIVYSQRGSNSEFAGLDLGNRVIVVHAGTPDNGNPGPVACGTIDPQQG